MNEKGRMNVMTARPAQQLLKETLISELQLLPEALLKAETEYYKLLACVYEKKNQLADVESELAAGRTNPVRAVTAPLHAEILKTEAEANRKLAEVNYLKRKLENCRLMANLLSN